MNLGQTVDALTRLLGSLGSVAEGMRCYHFGSSSRPSADSSRDFDVLIVYPSGRLRDAHETAAAIRDNADYPYFDVLALSEAEEAQTAFVTAQDARPLWPR